MFSEYASKFLAQSQSRLSNFGQNDNENTTPQAPERTTRFSRNLGRSYFGRGYGNPYQQSNSRYSHAFRSGLSAAQEAPLFASARDEFREEDEDEERNREAADLRALQRSRRVAAASKLADSVGSENEASNPSLGESTPLYQDPGFRRGIRSSWNGGRATREDELAEVPLIYTDDDSETAGSGKGRLVDVGLESQIEDDDPPVSLTGELPTDSSPPAFQQFNPRSDRRQPPLRGESTGEDDLAQSHRSTEAGYNPPIARAPDAEVFTFDPFFAWAYLISIASLAATFILIWLHTNTPDRKHPLGDTIYTTLHGSFYMLAADTLVAIATALLWLAALRSFVRPLVMLILVAVPVIMISFSLYPFISSFQGRTQGNSFQDSVMRWASTIPFIGAIVWAYCVFKGRFAIHSAIKILEFSSTILAENPALVPVGLGVLFVVVAWTWVWLAMFSRVFLGGSFATSVTKYIITVSSWWLGAWFVFMYMWTVSIITEVHRATTAATVSNWYFYRGPNSASQKEVVKAALHHAVTRIFGSICEATLLARLVRVPLLLLPARLSYILQRVANQFVPTPVIALTNPLTITYAAINSQNLASSARGLSQLDFLGPQTPTATLTPRVFIDRNDNTSGLLPYRLAKLILYASRFILATAMGFAAWVLTAKRLEISLPEGAGIRGSAYAYVVGIVASFIGYTVMGSMESILSGIVDAAVICYGAERKLNGDARYCQKADELFGDRRIRYGEDYA